MKTVYIGTDHAGFEYKEAIKKALIAEGYEVVDKGTDSEESCDYPDFIYPVAAAVGEDPKNRMGIVLGGSGNGEAMVANKVKGVRCAIGWSDFTVQMSREHNDANVLSIGARTISKKQAVDFAKKWLATPFPEDARHIRRIKKIDKLEGNL